MKKDIGIIFLLLALVSLVIGLVFGALAAFQFLEPEWLREVGFVKTRPLHVSFMVAWIFLSSVGGIYFYLRRTYGDLGFSAWIARIQMGLFIFTGLSIAACYLAGHFGGREYWEHPAWLGIPIGLSWILFVWNFFHFVRKVRGPWPVYLWMWTTGVVFFLLTFTESYLWLIPYFRDNILRDLTVQWKAYGALVGSWNMLVYGTAIYLMEQVRKDGKVAQSKLAFFMYFLGFSNLLFGWAHHLYTVPNAHWVRYISYLVSMTELIILARIIFYWRKSVRERITDSGSFYGRFMFASECWILLNLVLALAISVPAINLYTHGTHVTVAHAMGSTIGINTMILLASHFFAASCVRSGDYSRDEKRRIQAGFWILQISLLVFWCVLIAAGVYKGVHTIEWNTPFAMIMEKSRPFFLVFAGAGLGILIGLVMILSPLSDAFFEYLRTKTKENGV